MASPSKSKCGKCKLVLLTNPKNKGDQSIECDVCRLFYHIKCVGVSDAKLKLLDDDDVRWYCPICTIAASNLQEQCHALKAENLLLRTEIDNINLALDNQVTRVNNLEQDLKEDLTNKFNALQSQVDTLKINNSDNTVPVNSEPNLNTLIKEEIHKILDNPTKKPIEINNKDTTPDIRSIVNEELKKDDAETQLREKKKNNLIFFNFPEDTFDTKDELLLDDYNKIKEVCTPFTDLKEKDILQLFRIGKKLPGKTRPIIIKFKDEEQRMTILKNNKNLKLKTKDDDEIKVFITTDKTPKQRETELLLREEIKTRTAAGETDLVIRNEKIVPFRSGAQQTWASLFH